MCLFNLYPVRGGLNPCCDSDGLTGAVKYICTGPASTGILVVLYRSHVSMLEVNELHERPRRQLALQSSEISGIFMSSAEGPIAFICYQSISSSDYTSADTPAQFINLWCFQYLSVPLNLQLNSVLTLK